MVADSPFCGTVSGRRDGVGCVRTHNAVKNIGLELLALHRLLPTEADRESTAKPTTSVVGR
jgi:hypothetical protein